MTPRSSGFTREGLHNSYAVAEMRWCLRVLLWFFATAHFLFGLAGVAAPWWFYESVPPWLPLHVIQIAGVFDLALAVLFLKACRDLDRYLPVVVPVGVVVELGHPLVRICHIIFSDNPSEDLFAPTFMLLFGLALAGMGIRAWCDASRERWVMASSVLFRKFKN